jgi:hypothetical protein
MHELGLGDLFKTNKYQKWLSSQHNLLIIYICWQDADKIDIFLTQVRA